MSRNAILRCETTLQCAKIAAHYLSEEAYKSKCYKLLQPLFDDEELAVRKEANTVFRQKGMLTLDDMPEITMRYVQSKAFFDNPAPLLYTFEDHSGSLFAYADVLLSISKAFAGPLAKKSKDIFDSMLLIPLILRLYEQAQDYKHYHIQNLCLDIWDIRHFPKNNIPDFARYRMEGEPPGEPVRQEPHPPLWYTNP